MQFPEMMHLEMHGPDTYVGSGPQYPWGGLYGGQIVAQALRAAALTVDEGHFVHSLHAYFIRSGDHTEPIRFEVDRLRNGRSFTTRAVVARQSTGAILNMSASFQVMSAPTMDLQGVRAPQVQDPEGVSGISWSPVYEMRPLPDVEGGRARAWCKVAEPIGDDPLVHAAALAFLSDGVPGWVVTDTHQRSLAPVASWRPVSLDHAMWFHREVHTDQWLLFDFVCESLHDSRGLSSGRVFDSNGVLVATIAQEVLLRRPRPDGESA